MPVALRGNDYFVIGSGSFTGPGTLTMFASGKQLYFTLTTMLVATGGAYSGSITLIDTVTSSVLFRVGATAPSTSYASMRDVLYESDHGISLLLSGSGAVSYQVGGYWPGQ